jgi:hypothetical protein
MTSINGVVLISIMGSSSPWPTLIPIENVPSAVLYGQTAPVDAFI